MRLENKVALITGALSGIIGQRGVHVGYSASKGAVCTLTRTAAVHPGEFRASRVDAADALVGTQDAG
jgi:NAD(P)-dependent dehydrogenase (short-subunit alcohol dehydrogenase family)